MSTAQDASKRRMQGRTTKPSSADLAEVTSSFARGTEERSQQGRQCEVKKKTPQKQQAWLGSGMKDGCTMNGCCHHMPSGLFHSTRNRFAEVEA